ncbi:MAG TPA: heme-binding protein [Steroidobacteraceae bacterium]
MRTRPMLTLEDARKAMAACEAEAARNGWKVSIAIVDEAGWLMHLTRLDGVMPISAEVALGKARTAALTRRPSRFWEDRVKERPVFIKFPENLPITGGVPIMVGEDCVGAIGVSGVQSHEDEQIAIAGVAAIID